MSVDPSVCCKNCNRAALAQKLETILVGDRSGPPTREAAPRLASAFGGGPGVLFGIAKKYVLACPLAPRVPRWRGTVLPGGIWRDYGADAALPCSFPRGFRFRAPVPVPVRAPVPASGSGSGHGFRSRLPVRAPVRAPVPVPVRAPVPVLVRAPAPVPVPAPVPAPQSPSPKKRRNP